MPEDFAPAAGHRFAGRFELRAFLRGSGPARVFTTSDGSARPLVLVLFDPAACTAAAWAELARVATAATERGLAGVVPLRNVPPAPPDPPFCLADPPTGWSFDRLRQSGPPSWQKQGAPPWERALRLGERAAAILEAAYAALGVPHRALVPQRLVVTEADELVILDFGVGELEPVAGRPDDCGYRAPEQTASRGDVRSDVFSLAAVLFELIAGERFSPKLAPRLRSQVPGVPQAVDELFAEALAIDPRQRHGDMRELREAMRDVLGLGPAPAVSLSAPVVRSAPSPAADARASELEVDLGRTDLPVLPGSPRAPAPASAAPPGPERSLGSSLLGGVAAPPGAPLPSPGPVRSLVSAPPGGFAPPPVAESPAPPRKPLQPTLELSVPPSPAPSVDSAALRKPLQPTLELSVPSSPAPASKPLQPTLELSVSPSPAPANESAPASGTLQPTLELSVAPGPAASSESAPASGPLLPGLSVSPSPARSNASTPRGSLLPPLELPPSPVRSNAATPRGSLLPPLGLPPSPARSHVSGPLRGPLLPPVEPRPASVEAPPSSAASGVNKTEIDWTRSRSGTSPAPNAASLRYSKLIQPDAGQTDDLEPPDPDRPPAAKTIFMPQSPASSTAARTEIFPQSPAHAAAGRTEIFPQSPVHAAAGRTEIFPQSPAGSQFAESTSADGAELFDEDESVPAHRAARTEIFVGNSLSGRAERTEILVDDRAARPPERTEMLPPGPSFAEPPVLGRASEARDATSRSAPPRSAAAPPPPAASAPAKASGPSIKLLLIAVNAVLLVVIVLVLALR